MTNPRPSKTAPAAPTFAEMEESIRQRLHTNGQHGALAEFGKYTAAVHEQLSALQVDTSSTLKAFISTPPASGKPKAAAKPAAKKASSK